MRGGERELETCECGNRLTQWDIAQCEWCEYPDPPIYKVMFYGLCEMENHGRNDLYTLTRGDITHDVWATSKTNAQMIFDDYFGGGKNED